MQIEVRIRAKIDNPEALSQKIEEKGAYFEGSSSSTSWYYGRELFEQKDTQLRIVEHNYPEGVKKIYLTYKGSKSDNQGREEYSEIFGALKRNSRVFEKLGFPERDFTTPIDAEKVLEKHGLTKFLEVKVSDEKRYRYGVFEVKFFRLDQVNMDLLEIELNVTRATDIVKAQEEIYKLMDDLGVARSNEIKEDGVMLVYRLQK